MSKFLVIYTDYDLERSELYKIESPNAKGALKRALVKFLKDFVEQDEIQECVDETITASFRKTKGRGGHLWTASDEEGYWFVTKVG